MRRSGFTIIELLIVISIVVILVGLLMAGAKAVRQARIKSQSEVIVGTVANALAASIAEGKSIPIVPHPYAATAPGSRFAFNRGGLDPIRLNARFHGMREQSIGTPSLTGASATEKLWSYSGAWSAFRGTTSVSPTGVPILGGENVQWLGGAAATGSGERLLANDVLADSNIPIAFGVKRELLGMLGVANPAIHDHIVAPGSDLSGDSRNATLGVSQITSAVTTGTHAVYRVSGSANWEIDQEEAVHRALESSWSELQKLACLRNAGPVSTMGGRLASDSSFNSTYSKYQPGAVRDASDGNKWKSVSVPGMAVYDAWDRELFISMSADKRIRVISAGKDGCIRVDPNATATTPAINTSISHRFVITSDSWSDQSRFKGFGGDDKDGAYDNITQGVTIDDYLDRLTQAEITYYDATYPGSVNE